MKNLFLLSLLFCLSLQAQQPPAIQIPIQAGGWILGPGSRIDNGILIAGYGSSFSQTLSTTPAQLQEYKLGYTIEGTYILKLSVVNYFPSYPGYYTAEVSFGTQELCETSGWGTKSFTEVTLVCPGPGYLIVDKALPLGGPVQGQQPLVIKFSVNGWTELFDNVSLSFTPESQ